MSVKQVVYQLLNPLWNYLLDRLNLSHSIQRLGKVIFQDRADWTGIFVGFRDEALIALRNELFSRSDLPSLPLIITPLLIHRPNFPAIRYIELIDLQKTFPFDSSLYQNWKLYQLHALLLILDSRIDQLPVALARRIVAIIRFLINGFITTTNNDHLTGHDSDLDEQNRDEQMDIEGGRVV